MQKSGSYNTGSGNGHMRGMIARWIGAEWVMTMGDDCVEQYKPDAVARYASLGIKCKDYHKVENENFSFCSHSFPLEGLAVPETFEKTVGNLLCHDPHGPLAMADVQQALLVLRNHPKVSHFLEILDAVGWIGGKDSKQ